RCRRLAIVRQYPLTDNSDVSDIPLLQGVPQEPFRSPPVDSCLQQRWSEELELAPPAWAQVSGWWRWIRISILWWWFRFVVLSAVLCAVSVRTCRRSCPFGQRKRRR